MTTLKLGDKVTVTNICGSAVESHPDKKYQMIGQTGYVKKFYTGTDYIGVVIPEHMHYATGNGAALRLSEVETA